MIQSPIGWLSDRFDRTIHIIGSETDETYWQADRRSPAITIRRIGLPDVWQAVRQGAADLAEIRTDVIFLCFMYPIIGLVLGRVASSYRLLPLIFPIVSGFALVGAAAAIWLMEMSRRREQGHTVTWVDAFAVIRSPSLGAIIGLNVVMLSVFVLWLIAAHIIYLHTLGPEPPLTLTAFAHDVATTQQGWIMTVVGIGVGFLFAVLALSISVVSYPLLLERDVSMAVAIRTSLQVVAANPIPMAAWGLIVAVGLVLGSLPLLVGLVVVMPILGHATWHLYRRVVVPPS
jgi:uncharacterized membrane protein